MSIFNNNISLPLPTRIKVEQKVKEGILNIVDRVNNHYGECRLVLEDVGGMWNIVSNNTLKTLLNEIHKDITDRKIDLLEGTSISLGDTRCAKTTFSDNDKQDDKWGFNITIHVYHIDDENKDILKFDVDLDVFIYKHPHWPYGNY